MTKRPDIKKITTGRELKNWYWLKQELVGHCRAIGIPYPGSKQDITDRLAHFIDTGEVMQQRRSKVFSKFDWHSSRLTPETVITDNYKNTQNVRRFFKQHYGEHFAFNTAFMAWMKSNIGKTLADAVEARREIELRKRTVKPAIPAGNQYNRYIRDFFEANPGRTIKEARLCWTQKRNLEGHNRYESNDLSALAPDIA